MQQGGQGRDMHVAQPQVSRTGKGGHHGVGACAARGAGGLEGRQTFHGAGLFQGFLQGAQGHFGRIQIQRILAVPEVGTAAGGQTAAAFQHALEGGQTVIALAAAQSQGDVTQMHLLPAQGRHGQAHVDGGPAGGAFLVRGRHGLAFLALGRSRILAAFGQGQIFVQLQLAQAQGASMASTSRKCRRSSARRGVASSLPLHWESASVSPSQVTEPLNSRASCAWGLSCTPRAEASLRGAPSSRTEP